MKKIRKSLSLLLAVLLVLGMLAGCGANKEPEEIQFSGHKYTYRGSAPTVTPVPAGLDVATTKAPSDGSQKDYTIMLYVVGSDLESTAWEKGGGCASRDLEEIVNAGVDLARTNVLVMTGGAAYWHNGVPSDRNTIYRVGLQGLEQVAQTQELLPMGDPNTFLAFLQYAHETFPAKEYGLICWDHGGGPQGGFGNDELFGWDPLHINEMGAALAVSPFAQEKLTFLGFDACLMGTLEVAAMFKPYARYLVASQELEPGWGWDYSSLKALNTGTMEDCIKAILSTFETSMKNDKNKPEYTLSWVDLDQLDGLVAAMDVLFEKMARAVAAGDFAKIAGARNQALRFALKACSTMEETRDLVDLGSVAQTLGTDYAAEAAAVQDALGKAVVSQVSNVNGTSGLSLYYPYDSKTRFTEQAGEYVVFEFNPSQSFRKFMEGFIGSWLHNEPDPAWVAQFQQTQMEQTPAGSAVQVPQEQVSNVGRAYYSVLRYDAEADTYTEILSNCSVTPDANGNVCIPKDPQVFLMMTDTDARGALWPMAEVGEVNGQKQYVSVATVMLPSTQVISAGFEHVQVVVRAEAEGEQPKIRDVLPKGEEADLIGKKTVNPTQWGAVGTIIYHRYATQSPEGQLKPFAQWDKTSGYSIDMVGFGEHFYLNTAPLSQQEGTFYGVLTLEDTSGNVIGVKKELLKEEKSSTLKEVDTGKGGLMVFRVYDDHAELVSYEGEDENLTIPGEVEGVPVSVIGDGAAYYAPMSSLKLPDSVTHIGQDAFRSCRRLKSVTLPANLQVIGMHAFANSGLKNLSLGEKVVRICDGAFLENPLSQVTLPASLTYLGERVFAGCNQLTRFRADGNANFQVVDGVLFSADGKTLLAFPAGRSGKYTVPEGTEVIGASAFNTVTGLTQVVFPETLITIDREAFQNTLNLTQITLPTSLRIIGEAAFGADLENKPVTVLEVQQIPWQVIRLGTSAFSGYIVGQFQVDEKNAMFYSENGCLLNNTGTVLIQAPYGHSGALEVPEGVSYIGQDAFYRCDNITELTIPDSVVAISSAAFLPKKLTKITVGKGLTSWKNMWDLKENMEVEIHSGNAAYVQKDGSIYTKDGKELLLYRGSGESFQVPSGVERIHKNAFPGSFVLKELQLSATVTQIPERTFLHLYNLERFTVEAGSKAFAAEKGLLYTANGRELVAVPLEYQSDIVVREGVQTIRAYAFDGAVGDKVTQITIPETVTTIHQGNFVRWYYMGETPLKINLPASLVNISQESLKNLNNVEVSCPAGSAVEAYAKKQGLTMAQ